MNCVPVAAADRQQKYMAMPVLLKRYLRLSGVVGDGALVDYDSGMTDVIIMVREAVK